MVSMKTRTVSEKKNADKVRARLNDDGSIILTIDGQKADPDYLSTSGAARILIRSYGSLRGDYDWRPQNQGEAASGFLLQAASMGLLDDMDGNPVKLVDGFHQIVVRGNLDKEDTSSFTLGIKGYNEEIRQILGSVALAGDALFMVAADNHARELMDMCSEKIKKDNLPLFFSMLLSKYDFVDIVLTGYTVIQRKPLLAQPALVFREIDEYGYLHVIPDSHVEGFAPGVVSENGIIKAVSISDEDRTIEIRDIMFTDDPVDKFRTMLGRNTKNSVYEENGHFIIDGPFAESFIASHFMELLSSFALYNPEVLSKYKIRYARPKIHFRFSSGIDFLEGESDVEIAGETMSLDRFLSSYSKNNGFVLLNDKSRAYIDKAFMKKLERIAKIKSGKAFVSAFDIPYIEELDDIDVQGDALERIKEFYSGFNSIKDRKYSTSIKSSRLRDYQEYGYQWLRYLHDTGMGGCLADEMGLGKTIQIIALLNDVSASRTDKPSLLIAPKSIIYNWLSEIDRFGINLHPFVYYGQERDAEKLRQFQSGIVISSYATIRNDIQKIAEKDFDYVILDESQMIKHFNTRTAQAVLNLRSEHRIAVSGTPIENDLGELYSLFRFINPAVFPTLAGFDRDYVKPIMNDDKDAERELKMKIYPFILRRMKNDVLSDLPDKTEQTAYIDMAAPHWDFYEKRRQELKERVEAEVHSAGFEKSSFIILQALTELRQIAALPEGKMETDTISAKREYLREVLPEITAAGHKALIFTSFLDTVEKLGEDLEEMGIGFVTMTGATRDRNSIVTRFQTDPDTKVFLMTLKTGGVGLNLTVADYVFIFDPWWNSAAEEQAINRTHRIGQHNPVFCYRMIAKGTIEEKILELQEIKRELSSALITSDGTALKSLSEEDIENLLR